MKTWAIGWNTCWSTWYLCFLITLGLTINFAYSQEGFPVYNAYLFENGYIVHPSLANISGCGNFRFVGRLQWTGVEDAPQTFGLSYDNGFSEKSGYGVMLYSDKNGYSERTAIQITYAHKIMMRSNEDSFISMALSYNGYNFNTRYDKIFIDYPSNDPALGVQNNFWENNVNVSFSYINNYFFGSFTAYSLVPFFKGRSAYFESTNLRNYLFTVGNKFRISSDISYEPSILFAMYEKYKHKNLDINNKVYFYSDDWEFWFALSYRTFLDDGFNSALLTPMIGIEKAGFKLGYSYDINLGNIQGFYPASHQFSLGLDLFCN